MSVSDSIIQAESGGNANAANPNSSAVGAAQFIASTWLSVIKQHRPDLADGRSDDDILAMRADPKLSGQMADAYAADNSAILAKNGLPVTPGTTYLAHFAGPQGAVKILQADPNAPAADILGPAAVKANPFLAGMTAQAVQAWAAKKMGAQSPMASGQPQGAPTSLAPPQAAPTIPQPQAPIFAGAAPVAAPVQAPMQQMAPINPIFAQPRKPIDLSGLRAALAQRAPIFANQG